jgi:CubicO group peptidase (beta-lactamase class C family)
MKWLAVLLFGVHCSLAGAQLYYPPVNGNTWENTDPATLGWCSESVDSLYAYLERTNTKAFMVLKDGRIVLEKYFGTFTKDSLWVWNSAGKTLTAFAVGIAQSERYLDIDEPTSDHIGDGWSSLAPVDEERITIRHQLTMTTGLDDEVADSNCTSRECLTYLAAPGTRWAYHNAPYTLLESVMESATRMSLNQWVTKKIKTPTGMTGTYHSSDYNNIFVSNARSMARFGLLLQSRGYWNAQPVLKDDGYFQELTHSSQALNPSYGYLTWLAGQSSFMIPGSQLSYPGSALPHAPPDVFAADGKDGQFINISPAKGLVLIRMGNGSGSNQAATSYNDTIWQYVNRMGSKSCRRKNEVE